MCVQESFLKQYVEGLALERAILDLLLELAEVSMGVQFGTSHYVSIQFKIFMDMNWAGPQVKIINWNNANFRSSQTLAKVVWSRLFEGKGVSRKRDVFKSVIVQGIARRARQVGERHLDDQRDWGSGQEKGVRCKQLIICPCRSIGGWGNEETRREIREH